jgi:predicted MFS family arabinose efflux permease
MIEQFHESIESVAWTVNGYNLVLSLLVIPGWLIGRWAGEALTARIGALIFAAGAAVASAAPSLEQVVVGRGIMAVGAAGIVPATLVILAERRPTPRALAIWVATGGAAAAVGPALGGALTAGLDWRAVFWAQVPVALFAAVFLPWRRDEPEPAHDGGDAPADEGSERRARWGASLALIPVGAGIAASLFLLVLFLIEIWGYGALEAAGILTPMAVMTVLVGPVFTLAGKRIGEAAVVVGGIVAFAVGLFACAFLPADPAPLVAVCVSAFIGVGLGAILGPLTRAAMKGLDGGPLVLGASVNMAVRHLGLVIGLAVLVGALVGEINRQSDIADITVGNMVATSPLPTPLLTDLANELFKEAREAPDTGPNFGPLFDRFASRVPPEDAATFARLKEQVTSEVAERRARAFQPSFGWAAVLALLATAPAAWALAPPRRRRRATLAPSPAAS